MRWAVAIGGLALGLAGCGEEATLALDLRTDLGVGSEVTAARVERFGAEGDVLEMVDRPLSRDLDGATGFRLAELEVPRGAVRLRVRLEGPGASAERALEVQVDGPTISTIVIPRSCVGVRCDDANEACLADGRCCSVTCTVERPEACLEPACAVDADCDPPLVGCAVAACDPVGGCIAVPGEGTCAAGEVCDPAFGCVPDPDACAPTEERCDGADQDCDARVDEGACDCPVAQRGESSYLICEGPVDWEDARAGCRDVGYELATIDGAEEQAFVWDKASAGGEAGYWIGINDVASEGDYRWSDGTPVTFTAWFEGQPNDGAAGASEDCGFMTRDLDGAWSDGTCSLSFGAICERR